MCFGSSSMWRPSVGFVSPTSLSPCPQHGFASVIQRLGYRLVSEGLIITFEPVGDASSSSKSAAAPSLRPNEVAERHAAISTRAIMAQGLSISLLCFPPLSSSRGSRPGHCAKKKAKGFTNPP